MEKIPKVIYFCNKTLDKMKEYSDNWKKINPEYEIRLYDDAMCEIFLLNEYSKLHRDIYQFLEDGPIKADFWRICILNKYGGVYSDIDNEPLIPLNEFIESDVNFVTCSSYAKNNSFNPNFIISNKNNIILEKCIEWYIDKYNKKDPYGYWWWSIMRAFSVVLHLDNYHKNDGIYYLNQQRYDSSQSILDKDGIKYMMIQILKECPGNNHYDAHNMYNEKRVFNNRYKDWDFRNHRFKST